MELKAVVVVMVVFLFWANAKGDYGIFPATFYNKTCPQLENIVRDAMKSASLKDPHIPASLLRLMFHDCRVGGCDASILVDAKDPEIALSANYGIKNREVINEIKSKVEEKCPEQVSCADLIVLAAREAVAMSGGPIIDVQLGRRDSPIARSRFDAASSLPGSGDPAGAAVPNLFELGVSLEEAVALIGAHTLGDTHCFSLRDRLSIKSFPPGNERKFVKILKQICNSNDTTAVPMDSTPRVFDNRFFINVLNGYGVNFIDGDLRDSRQTRRYSQKFADDEEAFFRAFSSGFVKMSSFNILTGKLGVIRKQCNKL